MTHHFVLPHLLLFDFTNFFNAKFVMEHFDEFFLIVVVLSALIVKVSSYLPIEIKKGVTITKPVA